MEQVSCLKEQFCNKHEKIATEIYKRWISGAGRNPVTWTTLACVFKDIPELNSLAIELQTFIKRLWGDADELKLETKASDRRQGSTNGNNSSLTAREGRKDWDNRKSCRRAPLPVLREASRRTSLAPRQGRTGAGMLPTPSKVMGGIASGSTGGKVKRNSSQKDVEKPAPIESKADDKTDMLRAELQASVTKPPND